MGRFDFKFSEARDKISIALAVQIRAHEFEKLTDVTFGKNLDDFANVGTLCHTVNLRHNEVKCL